MFLGRHVAYEKRNAKRANNIREIFSCKSIEYLARHKIMLFICKF